MDQQKKMIIAIITTLLVMLVTGFYLYLYNLETQNIDSYYFSRDLNICAVADFGCGKGYSYFIDDVGCGCKLSSKTIQDKTYVGNSVEECATIRFVCDAGYEYFADGAGCGCVKEGSNEEVLCTPESRNGGICTKEYVPVCGWNDPEQIQCIRYPCAQTYGNACEACANENVISYTLGMCPD